MIYTSVDSPLWCLQWLEKKGDLDSPLKDQVLTLREELRFMRTYLVYLNMAKGIPSGSSSVINSVEAAIINSTKDLSSACLLLTGAAGAVVFSMLEKVIECKQEIRKDYAILWDQPWKSNTLPPCLALKEFVESILDNIGDLLGSKSLVPLLKENIEILKENMDCIAKFISIIEKRKVMHQKLGDFLAYVQVVVTRGACFSYFCWFDEDNASSHFSDLMQLTKRCASDCVDMCFEVLKASRDEVEWFLDFLLGNSALKLSMELPGHCKRDLRQISADIRAVAKEAGLLLISKDDHFHETIILLSSLLQTMSLIKEKISRFRLKYFEDSGVLVPLKEETLALHEGQPNFQTTFSVDLPKKKKYHQVTSLNYSIHGNKLTVDLAKKANDALFPLLKKIEDMYAKKQQNHPLKDQIKSFQEEITCIESGFEDEILSAAHPEDFTSEPAPLSLLFNANAITEGTVNDVNISLFELTKIIRAELILLEIRDDEGASMVHMNDHAEHLQEGLRFLRIFLMKPPRENNKKRELMLTKSEAMAVEAASAIFSFCESATEENVAMRTNPKILEALEKIELLKGEIREAYIRVPLSLHANLPDGLVLITSLLGHMEEVLNYKAHSIDFAKRQIEMLREEFESLKNFPMDTAESEHDDELKDLWTCITDVAYEAEYMIDSSVFGDDPEWCFMLWLPFAMEKIKLLKSKRDSLVPQAAHMNILDHQSLGDYNVAGGEVMVGLEDEATFMIDQLRRGSKHLSVVSIVGSPGLGKTTLAKKIYYSPDIASHFDFQVWYSASEDYQREEVFSDILHSVTNGEKLFPRMDYWDMACMLRKYLEGRRYLIVLDNLWHAEVWNDLRASLPDDSNGSRVFLTSQLCHVARDANPESEPYCLRPLSAEEGSELLQKMISPSRARTPVSLEDGKQISLKCKGIPLVIGLAAGLLARTDQTVDCLKQMTKSSRLDFFVDLEDILELCYGRLPDHLKSCFLYFGAFPENKEISVPKMLRLWIAEGFIQKNESMAMEDIAEEYLAGLIGRNLVAISQRSSRNGLKTCRISDRLRGFCIKKAREENFLQRANWSPLSNCLAFEKRRLCLCIDVGAETERSIMSKASTPCVRCLFCSVRSNMDSEFSKYVYLNLDKFGLLTVLDLESIKMGNSFPTGLLLLELLRYLAVRGGVKCVPSSLANLWNLETLVIKGSRGSVMLPSSFFSMKKLKHVHILPLVTFNLGDNELECSDLVLRNMFSLSTPVILNGNSAELLRSFPSLGKLKLILVPSNDSLGKIYSFPALEFLCQLESLNISPIRRRYYPCQFNLPGNLKKLTLSKFGLPWSETSVIGKLPNLHTLKLQHKAFQGQLWNVGEGEFPKLKYLKLDFLDLAQWVVSSDSFPVLEQIVIHRCWLIRELPSFLGKLPTLQMIEIQSCRLLDAYSAEQLFGEQQEMGNMEFKVLVDASRSNNKHYSSLVRSTYSYEYFCEDEEEDEKYDIEEDTFAT